MQKIIHSLFIFLLFPFLNLQAQCNTENKAFKNGEVLSYDLYFNWKFIWIPVGTAAMNISSAKYKGTEGFHAYLISRGSSTADKYFVLRDTLESYIDTNLNPLYFAKRALEGSEYRLNEVYYGYENGKTRTKTHYKNPDGKSTWKDFYNNTCVYDMLSMLLKARSFEGSNYKKNQRIKFTMVDGNNVYNRDVIFKGYDKVKLNNSNITLRCMVFTYVEQQDNEEKPIVTFYISDDANHIPVRLDMNLKIGCAKAFLKGMIGLRNPLTSIIK